MEEAPQSDAPTSKEWSKGAASEPEDAHWSEGAHAFYVSTFGEVEHDARAQVLRISLPSAFAAAAR